MALKERVAKYRTTGGGADQVRVEVLVPASSRGHILEVATKLRAVHRGDRELSAEEQRMFDEASSRYGARCLWKCRPARTVAGMRMIAERLKTRGDMTAWRFALQIEAALADAPRRVSEARTAGFDASTYTRQRFCGW